MTVTLDLAPETEQRLRRKAARQGEDVTTYLQHMAEREAEDESPALSDEEFEVLLGAVSEGSENWPALPPSAFERASFYDEKG